jgi:hypothetical protein
LALGTAINVVSRQERREALKVLVINVRNVAMHAFAFNESSSLHVRGMLIVLSLPAWTVRGIEYIAPSTS